MKLTDYPQAIAKLQRQILSLDQSILGLQETLSILGLELEKQVIADASLSNDTKRKARRLELQQSDLDYCKAANELKTAQAKRDGLDIDLLLLRNQFTVLKLEERRAIASLELHSAA
ncbi:MAG: hypothetical protein ACKO7W_17880 [Elainella sp.]